MKTLKVYTQKKDEREKEKLAISHILQNDFRLEITKDHIEIIKENTIHIIGSSALKQALFIKKDAIQHTLFQKLTKTYSIT